MDNDIRENAMALIEYIGGGRCYVQNAAGNFQNLMEVCRPYEELKNSLRPSRSEIADYLEKSIEEAKGGFYDYINYAIYELRKDK